MTGRPDGIRAIIDNSFVLSSFSEDIQATLSSGQSRWPYPCLYRKRRHASCGAERAETSSYPLMMFYSNCVVIIKVEAIVLNPEPEVLRHQKHVAFQRPLVVIPGCFEAVDQLNRSMEAGNAFSKDECFVWCWRW